MVFRDLHPDAELVDFIDNYLLLVSSPQWPSAGSDRRVQPFPRVGTTV